MAALNPNPPEALSEEILAEARCECDEIVRRARQSADSLLAVATAEADKLRREKFAAARAEAARRRELILATIPVEAGRLRSARRETILESIHEEARRLLQTRKLDGREIVVALAIDAVSRMPGNDFVLKISAADHASFGNKLADEIQQRAGRVPLQITVSADPLMTGGGVIVQDATGDRIWDNRLISRLERFWPELRREIAVQTSLVEKSEANGGLA